MEKGITTHSSILALEILQTEELGGLQSMGSQHYHFHSNSQLLRSPEFQSGCLSLSHCLLCPHIRIFLFLDHLQQCPHHRWSSLFYSSCWHPCFSRQHPDEPLSGLLSLLLCSVLQYLIVLTGLPNCCRMRSLQVSRRCIILPHTSPESSASH